MITLLFALTLQDSAEAEARKALAAYTEEAGDEQDEQKVCTALKQLQNIRHTVIYDKYKALLKHKSPKVRLEVVFPFGEYTDRESTRTELLGLLKSEAARARIDAEGKDADHEVACAAMVPLPRFMATDAMLNDLKAAYKHKNVAVAQRAVQTFTAYYPTMGKTVKIKADQIVGPLVELLKELEGLKVTEPKPAADGTPPSADAVAKYRRKTELTPVVLMSLGTVTKVQKATAAEYEEYWATNKPKDRPVGIPGGKTGKTGKMRKPGT